MASLTLALGAGLALAWYSRPLLSQHRALSAIGTDDASDRASGWATLTSALSDLDALKQDTLLKAINLRLDTASDAALLDAAATLEPRGLWGWDRQPASMVLRGVDAQLATGESVWQLAAAETLATAPFDLAPAEFLSRIQQLLEVDDQSVRDPALDAALAWAGLGRVKALADLQPASDDDRSQRRLEMARWWAERGLDFFGETSESGAIPKDALLSIQDVDEAFPMFVALSSSVSNSDVYCAVLYAECLDGDSASELAEQWIRSLDDDRKRAGAMLAALLGTHRDLLRRAYQNEDVPAVRATQRLALFALEDDPGPGDALEFAERVSHEEGGRRNLDVAFLLMCANHPSAFAWLLDSPSLLSGHGADGRPWMITRFFPQWERPLRVANEETANVVQQDKALNVLRVLTERRMAFDRETRQYRFDPEA